MKANELMIGDWVQGYLPDTFSTIVGVLNAGMVAIRAKGAYIELSIDDIQPIPLTAEILEKNGWKYNELPFIQGWEQFGLLLYAGGESYRINCGNNVAMKIDSVHELQHALRLCGIDKEIVL